MLERLLVVGDCTSKTTLNEPLGPTEGCRERSEPTLLPEALLQGRELSLARVDALVDLLGHRRDAL